MAYISFQPSDYFNTKLYTGTGSSNTVTGVGFQPDFTWIKNRGDAESHCLFDAVRTNGYYLKSDATSAEIDGASAGLWSAFASDGFTVLNGNRTNDNGDTYASWNWKANGAGSSNTDGSINTTYTSANTTSGFSIIKYTGTGSAGATIGTGLGVKPAMIIIKNLNVTQDWVVYHQAITANKILYLNMNNETNDNNVFFNDTEPTNSLITLGSNSTVNGSGNSHIAYCFAPIKGFSAMGSYVGNGSTNGSFIYTNGMKPAFIMIKRTDSSASWVMFDSKRLGYNVANYQLYANSSTSYGNNVLLDITSQGFKCRANHLDVNGSGASYIFMAFAEAPLVSSNGVPATAR
nr:hypothetical protein [uncultured Mediterranean phage uvMED]